MNRFGASAGLQKHQSQKQSLSSSSLAAAKSSSVKTKNKAYHGKVLKNKQSQSQSNRMKFDQTRIAGQMSAKESESSIDEDKDKDEEEAFVVVARKDASANRLKFAQTTTETTTFAKESETIRAALGSRAKEQQAWPLVIFVAWCAFAEKTGVLETTIAKEFEEDNAKKMTKNDSQKLGAAAAKTRKSSVRLKERAKEIARRNKLLSRDRVPKISFQRGKTYFTEKRFKKSITTDGREFAFDKKGEELKKKLANVEILKKELEVKRAEEAIAIERERSRAMKEAAEKARMTKEKIETEARKKIEEERKKIETEQKLRAKQERMLLKQKKSSSAKNNAAGVTTTTTTTTIVSTATKGKSAISSAPQIKIDVNGAKEKMFKSASAFADFSKSISSSVFEQTKAVGSKAIETTSKVGSSAFETTSKVGSKAIEATKTVGSKAIEATKTVGSKAIETTKTVGSKAIETTKSLSSSAIETSKVLGSKLVETSKSTGSAVVNISTKARDVTVDAANKATTSVKDLTFKTKDAVEQKMLAIEAAKIKKSVQLKQIPTANKAKPTRTTTTTKSNIEALKPPNARTKTKEAKKTENNNKATKQTSSLSTSTKLDKTKQFVGKKMISVVEFTKSIQPPSLSLPKQPTLITSAMPLQEVFMYSFGFACLVFTSAQVRKNRRERAKGRAEREIRLAADREKQKARWTKAIAQNPDSSQLLGNRLSSTAKTISKESSSKLKMDTDKIADEVREANEANKKQEAAAGANESGWDEKEYEKMNKEYQKFLKDSRLPKKRGGGQ
jgi:hypothetical protein